MLSCAIHETPRLVSIRQGDRVLGRTMVTRSGRPNALGQVYLAGFAGEHLLTGRRPPQLRAQVNVTFLHLVDPELVAAQRPWETDGFLAVMEVLRMGLCRHPDEVRSGIERLYQAALASLYELHPAVHLVAGTLLAKDELRPRAFRALVRGYRPVQAVRTVQWLHGVDD